MTRIVIDISASKPAAGELIAVYLQGVLDQADISAVIDTPGRGRAIPPETAASLSRHQLRDLVGRGARIAIRVGGQGRADWSTLLAAAANFASEMGLDGERRPTLDDLLALNFASERGLDGERRPTLDDLLAFLDRVGETTMGPIVMAMGGDDGAVGDLMETAAAYLHLRAARESDKNMPITLYSRARRGEEGSTHG